MKKRKEKKENYFNLFIKKKRTTLKCETEKKNLNTRVSNKTMDAEKFY